MAKLFTACTHRDSSSKGSVARRAGKREIAREFWKRRKKKESEDTRNRHNKTRHYYIALCMCLVYTSDLGERVSLCVCLPPTSFKCLWDASKKEPKSLAPQESLHRNFLPLYSARYIPICHDYMCRPTLTNGKYQRERRGKSLLHNALTAYRVDLYIKKHPKIVKNTLFKK
jgi:hypothetical protein